MTKNEVTRALQRYRYDPDGALAIERRERNDARRKSSPKVVPRAGGNPDRVVPFRCIAALARLDRHTVLRAQHGFMTDSVRVALSNVIEQIESGRVRFVRARGPAKGQPRWSVEYRSPPSRLPQPQDKITRSDDHREWARCLNCGGQLWQSVVIADAVWYACRSCVGRDQWPAMGARETNAVEKLALPESQMRQDFR